MQHHRLQDRISRGLGSAARHIGAPYDAYRPTGPEDPLAPANRYLRLSAAFDADNPSFHRPSGYGRASRFGIFDSAYTKPGDYLCGPEGTFFVAAQQTLLPMLCVLTNRLITVFRPAAPSLPGLNGYGGFTAATARPVLTEWPASVLSAGSGGPGDLPGDASIPTWTVLLPATPVAVRAGDLIRDDLDRAYVIGSAESTALGWRILAKQAAT